MSDKKMVHFGDLRYSSGGIGHTEASFKCLVAKNTEVLSKFANLEEILQKAKSKLEHSKGIKITGKINLVK